MITIAHLMDDFGMGGVTRALTLFDEPSMQRQARSKVVPVKSTTRIAPKIDADMIVDHGTHSWARLPFLISLRARNPKARIIHIEHSYTRSFEESQDVFKPRFRAMLKLAAVMVDEIVCVSNAQRDWLAGAVGIAPEKLRVIYPWTDRSELFDVPSLAPRGDRPLRLLAYGRYTGVKNFEELVRAMRSFYGREVHLTVFGDGPNRSRLTALAAHMPHVDIKGPSLDPRPYLADCDAVIIPSRYEAFGLVATEARMAARPVIVADVDGLPEQVGEGGLVVPMATAYTITQAIRSAARADLVAMGQAARESVRNQHKHILAGWSELIASVEVGLQGEGRFMTAAR
ncbi:MAG: glycosyltransferase family 4 protein [Pseudomonadota bacterium]